MDNVLLLFKAKQVFEPHVKWPFWHQERVISPTGFKNASKWGQNDPKISKRCLLLHSQKVMQTLWREGKYMALHRWELTETRCLHQSQEMTLQVKRVDRAHPPHGHKRRKRRSVRCGITVLCAGPATVRQLRSFLGLAGFYSPYVLPMRSLRP